MHFSKFLASAFTIALISSGCGNSGNSNQDNSSIISSNIKAIQANNKPVGKDIRVEVLSTNKANGTLVGADQDGDEIKYIKTSDPLHGKITKFDEKTGTFSYQPDDDYEGEDSFSYCVSDGKTKSEEKRVICQVKKSCDETTPNAPSNLKVEKSCGCTATLTWDDNSDNENGFNVYVNGELYCVADKDQTSMIVKNLEVNREYLFEVKAVNLKGESKATSKNFFIEQDKTAPKEPKNLSVVCKTDNSIRVSWDYVETSAHYDIYLDGKKIKEIDSGCTTILFDDLDAQKSYDIKVIAVNSFGESNPALITVTTNKAEVKPEPKPKPKPKPTNKKPTVKADDNKVITLGDSVKISATANDSDGQIVKYEWIEDGKVISSQNSFDYTPTTLGEHKLIITVTDDKGATASDTLKVTVNKKKEPQKPNQAPTANAGEDKSVEEGKTVTLSGSGSDTDGSVVSYKWSENGTILGNSATLNYKATTVGDHTLTLTVTDNKGATGSDSVKVTVTAKPNQAPTANAGEDKSVEEGKTVTLNGKGTDTDGTIASYQWKEGNTVLGNSATLNYKGKTVGEHTLTLIVTDNDGATGSDEVKVTVTAKPNQAPTANAGEDKSIQLGETVTLNGRGTDTDGTIASYQWKEGNTVLGSSAKLNYKGETVGEHTLTLIVTDNDGATGSDEVKVTVTAKPKPQPIDPYVDWNVAKSNALAPLEQQVGEYTVKILTNANDIANVSNDAYVSYGSINGQNITFQINKNYNNNSKFVARVYNSDGSIYKTSKEFNFKVQPYYDFGSL